MYVMLCINMEYVGTIDLSQAPYEYYVKTGSHTAVYPSKTDSGTQRYTPQYPGYTSGPVLYPGYRSVLFPV